MKVKEVISGQKKEKIKKVELIISDLHLGEGWTSNLEAFHDDDVFKHFIKMIVKKYAGTGTEVILILNGDVFDPLAVLYKGKSITIPYERVDLYKMRKIISGHPYVFLALREFISHDNFYIKFIPGNHDLFLHWPAVQNLIIRFLREKHAPKIFFIEGALEEDGIYIKHGNTESHSQTSDNPITDQTISVIFKKDRLKKMLGGELFEEEEVLDVPLEHHLVTALQNPLKKHNLLIGHMKRHGFVWFNAILNMGRKTWYRNRFFFAVAIFMGIWIMIKYWLYTRDRGIVRKILRTLWWTIVGSLEGQTPRDEAKRLLEREDVSVVIFGHDHKACYETVQVGSANKLYINSGTWQLRWEVKVEPIKLKWKYFKRVERTYRRIRRFLSKLFSPAIEEITKFPVVEIIYKEVENDEDADDSNTADTKPVRNIKLMQFNDNTRDLEEFV